MTTTQTLYGWKSIIGQTRNDPLTRTATKESEWSHSVPMSAVSWRIGETVRLLLSTIMAVNPR